jgi:DNA polymerase III subunit chi
MAVDFHFNVDDFIPYACRVVRKARSAGKTVFAYSRNDARLRQFDLALWTFSALDFLPHVLLPSNDAGSTPVWLGSAPAREARDVLLLLDDEVAPQFEKWFAGFERVIDLVSTEPADRQLARARFAAYRDAGLMPKVHDTAAD